MRPRASFPQAPTNFRRNDLFDDPNRETLRIDKVDCARQDHHDGEPISFSTAGEQIDVVGRDDMTLAGSARLPVAPGLVGEAPADEDTAAG